MNEINLFDNYIAKYGQPFAPGAKIWVRVIHVNNATGICSQEQKCFAVIPNEWDDTANWDDNQSWLD